MSSSVPSSTRDGIPVQVAVGLFIFVHLAPPNFSAVGREEFGTEKNLTSSLPNGDFTKWN